MKNNLVLFLLWLVLVPEACTERIEIETDEEYIRLVVDGAFTTEKMSHIVRLTTTADYFSGKPAPVVTGATVTITDGSVTHHLRESSPGMYRTLPEVSAIPGHRYTLHIMLDSPVGGHSEYTAVSAVLPPVPFDSIQIRFHPAYSEAGMWEARGFFRDPPGYDFFRFMAFRNGILVTDTLSEWYITDDFLFGGNYVNGWTVAFLQQHKQDEAFAPGDTFSVRMDRISRAYAGFIQGVQSELRGSFPLFTGPPANVKGNISNGALGFFEAYSHSSAFAIIPTPDQYP